MKKFIILTMFLAVTIFSGISFGVETQIIAERFKHADPVFFVYQPTQKGDWYRWRVVTPLLTGNNETNTYPCIAGVTRGKVYAGEQKKFDESDARNGFTSSLGNTWLGFPYVGTKTFTEFRDYNKPADMTHVRVWFRKQSSDRDVARISFFNSSNDEISRETYDTSKRVDGVTPSSGVSEPTGWYLIPSETTYVRVHKDTDDTTFIQMNGVDWINKNSEVSPDTAGSLMFDSVDGNSKTVINDDWGQYWSATSVELALFWDDDGQPYSTNAIGGISHRGIVNDSGTVNWQSQSGSGDPADFDLFNGLHSTHAGLKLLVDYTILDMTGLTAYAESNFPYDEARGTVNAKLILDISGAIIFHEITATFAMDVFQFYTTQCRMPNDVNKVFFSGDSEVKDIGVATLRSPVKSTSTKVWGGASETVYDVINNNIDDNDYFKHVFGTTAMPRVFASEGEDPKIYMNQYLDETTPLDMPIDDVLTTRFRIKLTDESLGAVGSGPTTTEISIMGPTVINILGPN